MSCIRISTYIPTLPSHLTDNGVFYFETNIDFDIKVAKFLNQLTDIQQIRIDGFYGFELESKCKNDILLKRFIDPHSYDRDPIDVRVHSGSSEFMYYSLYVVGFSDGKYQCEIRITDDHWIRQVQKLRLNEVDYNDSNPFVFTTAGIQAINNLGAYVDNTLGIRFPVVNYGKFLNLNAGLTLGDFRPLFMMTYLLQKIFCHVGWKFRSTIFESNYGRRLICYLLDKDYGIDIKGLDNYKVSALQQTPKEVPGKDSGVFYTVIFDNVTAGTSVNYSAGELRSAGIFDIDVNLNFYVRKRTIGPSDGVEITLVLFYYRGTERFILERQSRIVDFNNLVYYTANVTRGTSLGFKKDNVQIDVGDYVTLEYSIIYLGSKGPSHFVIKYEQWLLPMTTNRFIATAKKIFIQENSDIRISNIIRRDKAIDFLKGCLHLVNGKIYTDYIKKEVWIYPAENTKISTENIQGFFNGANNVDITDIIDTEAINVDIGKKSENRYERLKYKGDGDGAIDHFTEKQGFNYHSYLIDYGKQYEEIENENENPYFEATYNGLFAGLDQDSGMEILMPFMYSSYEENPTKQDFAIQPRVLYWHGLIRQRQFKPGLSYPDDYAWPVYVYLNTSANLIPLALSDSGDRLFGNGTPEIIETTLAYGTKKNDLFTTFYQRWLYHTKYNKEYDLLVFFTAAFFSKYNFRDSVTFTAFGRTTIGRLLEITDFSLCVPGYVPTKVIPIIDSDNCSITIPNNGDPTLLKCEGNSPVLEVAFVDHCYVFGISGTNAVAINSVKYEIRYVSQSYWIVVIGNQICSPTEAFYVRMTVNYADDCPTLIRTKFVDVCGNSPELTATFNYLNNCFIAVVGGLITSDILSTVYTYSTDNGVTFLPYTNPNCQVVPNGTTEIIIKATVTYDDICPATDLEITLLVDVNPNQCEKNVDVNCDSSGNIIRNGDDVSDALDMIFWKPTLSDQWRLWDEVSTIPCDFYYKRVVILCGVNCPPICTDEKFCDCSGCNENHNISCINRTLTITPAIGTITWVGPNGFTGAGASVMFPKSTPTGTFTATVVNGSCTYTVNYPYTKPNAGTPTGNPIIV